MENNKKEAKVLIDFSEKLEKSFFESLEVKTNWGRNDLKDLFKVLIKKELVDALLDKIK